MLFERIYDDRLAQASYLIGCQKKGEAVVIDPERDVDRYIELAKKHGLRITAITETHIHADFLSGARELAEKTGATLYLSDEGGEGWRYGWLESKEGGGRYTHEMLYDGDSFNVGNVEIKAVHTPGHTPEHLSFMVTDHGSGADDPIGIATGDFVFVGDVGRPDLLETAAGVEHTKEPAARDLWESLRWFERLEDYIQVWPGHGAGSACGKSLGALPMSTVGYERRFNGAVASSRNESAAFTREILDGQVDPPYYFARMKKENRDGPALLGELPKPDPVAPSDIVSKIGEDAVLLDTRDWSDFRTRHLTGSYFTPFDSSFPTVAGSYVRPEQTVYLVIDPENVDEAVRNLVRVGIDNVVGYITPEAMGMYLDQNSDHKSEITSTTAEGLAATLREKEVTVLDVRADTEYREGHVRGALQLAHTRLPAGVHNLPEGPLYVHCQSGARSAIASAYLQAHGHEVMYVGGNFSDFADAGLSIAKSPATEGAAA